MPQGFDWVHAGGADGRVDAEDDPNDCGDGEGNQGGPERNNGLHPGKVTHQPGNRHSEKHSNQTASAREHHRFKGRRQTGDKYS